MTLVINNLDIWKKEISFDELLLNWEFLYKLSTRLEYLEDQILWKDIKEADLWNYVWEEEILNLLDSKIWK